MLRRLLGRITILPFRVLAYILHATGLERVYKPRFTRHSALLEIDEAFMKRLPTHCRTMTGVESDPINLVVVGYEDDITALFRRAKWHSAHPASPLHVVYAGLAALFRRSYRSGPFAPLYINIGLQDLAFQHSGRGASFRERHHLRLWRTGSTLSDGTPVWVGAAGRENGMRFGPALPFWSHTLDPNLDAERSYVVASLERRGAVCLKHMALSPAIAPNRPKRSIFNSLYHTDGRAAILEVTHAA